MRSILIVLGIAIVAVGIAIVLQKPKDLTPDPQGREEARKTAADKDVAQRNMAGQNPSSAFNPPREGVVTAVMTIAGKGDVTMEFYPKAAPKTVANMTKLIKSGFYNGILFHRVEPGFVVQAGDPETKKMKSSDLAGKSKDDIEKLGLGRHGSETPVPFESNNLQHVTGTVSMALKSPNSDTGDSQFFINLADNHPLDGKYCVFGKVTNGMDVVNRIQIGDAIQSFVIR